MKTHVYLAQKPLRASYETTPALATVTDHACTRGSALHDPFRTRVESMDGCGVEMQIGTHAALGGPHDAPTPGDMLCAALAAERCCVVQQTLKAPPNVETTFVGLPQYFAKRTFGISVRPDAGRDMTAADASPILP